MRIGPDIVQAAFNDHTSVCELLDGAGLPVPGTADCPVQMFVARYGAEVVGCVGMERHGRQVLLRSLAVRADLRGRGVGIALVQALLKRAKAAEAEQVFLLTQEAQEFFLRSGFTVVERDEVAGPVRESREFALHSCDSATCMRYAPTPT